MANNICNKIFLCLIVLLNCSLSHAENKASGVDFSAFAERYNIKLVDNNGVKLPKNDGKAPSLTSEDIRTIGFLLGSQEEIQNDIINEELIEKLLLFKKEQHREFFYDTVFDGRLKTGFGQVRALFTLSKPTTDLDILHTRQQAISLLHKDSSFMDSALAELTTIGKVEKKALLTFAPEKMGPKEMTILPKSQLLPSFVSEPMQKVTRENPFIRDADIILRCGSNISIIASSGYGLFKVISESREKIENDLSATSFMQAALITAGIIAAIASNCNYLQQEKKELENCAPYRNMFGEVKNHMAALHRLSIIVNENKELLTLLPDLQPLADFNDVSKRSPDLKHFISILEAYDFEGDDRLFYRKGPILAAKSVLDKGTVKEDLTPVLVAAGKLDMYVALAQLYGESGSKQAKYCMPQFIQNSPVPFIKAKNFWNPYIPADKAIANSITFDEKIPNAIITGPNTGGKSTLMKGLALNLLMAQSYGIAPSEKLIMTPFSKMRCLMNSSDDVTQGVSLFKSEVLSAQEILTTAENLQDGQVGFFVMDEMCTGTAPEVGEEITRRFAKKMGDQRRAISFMATHYKDIADKKRNPESRYSNFQMDLQRNEDGSFKRTFKLKEGEATENIAFEIIKETGLKI